MRTEQKTCKHKWKFSDVLGDEVCRHCGLSRGVWELYQQGFNDGINEANKRSG